MDNKTTQDQKDINAARNLVKEMNLDYGDICKKYEPNKIGARKFAKDFLIGTPVACLIVTDGKFWSHGKHCDTYRKKVRIFNSPKPEKQKPTKKLVMVGIRRKGERGFTIKGKL